PGPHVQEGKIGDSTPVPGPALADGGGIGVVVDGDLEPYVLLEEPLDRHFRPAVPSGRRRDEPLALVDGPGAGGAHSEHPVTGYDQVVEERERRPGRLGD